MRREREAKGLTLEKLAERLGLKRAAPLSTLERSSHVPKAETIREYAAALGCSPADLLAGVMTEYDVLRGTAAPTTATAPQPEKLTPIEKRALMLLRMTAAEGQRDAVRSLALHARAFPAEPSRVPTARTDQKPSASSRKERGRR